MSRHGAFIFRSEIVRLLAHHFHVVDEDGALLLVVVDKGEVHLLAAECSERQVVGGPVAGQLFVVGARRELFVEEQPQLSRLWNKSGQLLHNI